MPCVCKTRKIENVLKKHEQLNIPAYSYNASSTQMAKFHLARLDTFDFVERVETNVSSRDFPTWQTTKKQ